MDDCRIYVVSHKDFKIPGDDIYVPIQVGVKDDIFNVGCRDNTGDNIAKKNANYCELTALYWIWKNICNVTNVGICHYRRYFAKNIWSNNERKFIDKETIMSLLKKYDIIVPRKLNVCGCVKTFYYIQGEGKKKDLNTTMDVISEKYPDYIESFDSVLNDKSAFYCNMFITSKSNFDAYCKWLFEILFEVEHRTDLSDYTSSEARIYGYLSEILLNVWVKKNNLKVKYYPIINTEQTVKKRVHDELDNIMRGIVNYYGEKN